MTFTIAYCDAVAAVLGLESKAAKAMRCHGATWYPPGYETRNLIPSHNLGDRKAGIAEDFEDPTLASNRPGRLVRPGELGKSSPPPITELRRW